MRPRPPDAPATKSWALAMPTALGDTTMRRFAPPTRAIATARLAKERSTQSDGSPVTSIAAS